MPFSQTNKCKTCKRRKQITKPRTKVLISESFVRWSTRRLRRTQRQLTNDFESGAFFLVQYFYNIVNCICLDQLSVFLTSARWSTWKLTQFPIRPKISSAHRFSSEFDSIKSFVIGFMGSFILHVQHFICWDFVGMTIQDPKFVGMDPNSLRPKPRPSTLRIFLTWFNFNTKMKLFGSFSRYDMK